ncbi:gamma carbonic anhydrase family protein [Sphingobium boeckii]|uniref:Carbonic anhydrase/acetyltransferase-like protein (Isoleucine patch superfamily) n=1 Tax=Sphingobium boeckii TaxID=1082345 RepID=A0A7W9AI36_9SPHN|nr:gamma carbonic anhydrase family protein [Sphingobium boeckii]MBB5685831.1 carbonic anhydrase/acetyltransferase-like protein (isoleucine patch superfamily) [Sphingobium boeckii]
MADFSIIPFNGKTPRIDPSAFIAPGCRIIGDVEIGPEASIWYNCVLRGDVNFIRVGARTNIQDGSVIHCDSGHGTGGGYPTIIGDDVLIGHLAMVHGTLLKDRSFVGLGAITMDGTVIESGGMIAAGGMLTPGKTIGANELWTGRPAKLMRVLTDEQVAGNMMGVEGYRILARAHKAENAARLG